MDHVQTISDIITSNIHRRCLHQHFENIIIYGIRRSLIGDGSITEVKQRRARFLIGWVTAWDCQVLYTLGHVARSDVVLWGSENHVNQMARLTELELDIKEPQWT